MNGTTVTYVRDLRQEITEKYIFGHGDFIDLCLIAYLVRGHVLVEGPPGTAKTLTAKLLSRYLAKSFKRIQFTTDLLPGDILGAHIFSPAKQAFVFVPGPIFADFILADEVNRTPPRTQSALLEAMEERQVTIDGERHPLSPEFFVIATQNPQDYEGTFPLPEVQMDRFLFKLVMHHAPPEVEVRVLEGILAGQLPPALESIPARPLDRVTVDKELASVRLDASLLTYVSRLLERTRRHPMLVAGSGVRGGIALVRAARATALLKGRDFVTPDDLKYLALPTLRHRVRLNSEAQVSHLSEEDVLREILNEVPFPT